MLNLDGIKIRMDAKTEANSEFSFRAFGDHKYVLQIERIFNRSNNKILEWNHRIVNRNKLLKHFFIYLKDCLKMESTNELNINEPTSKDYSFLTTLIDADIAKWFVKDYMNNHINRRIDIIDTIDAIIEDIVSLKELLIIQFEENKLALNK